MNLNEVQALLATGQIRTIKDAFSLENDIRMVKNALGFSVKPSAQYNPSEHDINDKVIRKDKVIYKESEEKPGEDSKQVADVIPVWRISLPIQKNIIDVAAGILGAPEFIATPKGADQEGMLDSVKLVFDDVKFTYKFREIFKRTQSEGASAVLFYRVDSGIGEWDGTPLSASKHTIKMRILSPALGDELYPIYNLDGDMVAFGRYYESLEAKAATRDLERTCHFDIYTADRYWFLEKKGSGDWQDYSMVNVAGFDSASITGIPNLTKKIPVVYFNGPLAWEDVQPLIHRLEVKISNMADNNDYTDSPITVGIGDVQGFAEKGEQGKFLQVENGGDVKYLTADNAPESMRMEIENLLKFIGKYSHTPDFSFESVKGLGPISGIALKMLFLDAHMKAADNEAIFGQGVQRMVNYIKQALSVYVPALRPALKMAIKPKFNYFLPVDVAGEVDYLAAAVEGKILSRETAVGLNPLVEDAIKEMEKIKAEEDAASKIIPPVPPVPPVNP